MYTHWISISENKNHEYEREKGVYYSVWREEREGGDDIIIQFLKQNKTKQRNQNAHFPQETFTYRAAALHIGF